MNAPDLTTAEWLPLEHDWDTDIIQFAQVSIDDYGNHQDEVRKRVMADNNATVDVHMNDVPVIPYQRTMYFMHLAYGGSTLVSKLLNVRGKILSHIEPITHCRGRLDGYDKLARLYSRNFKDEVSVVKTIPLEIEGIDEYIDRHPDNVCVLFHQTLENFIISCFNPGSDRTRKAVINLSAYMNEDWERSLIDEQAVQLFIDYWTSKMSSYKEAILHHNNDRVIGLRSEDFFMDPVKYSMRLAELIGKPFDPIDIENAYRKLNIHSKWGTPFDEDKRIQQKLEATKLAQPYLDLHRHTIDQLDREYRFPDNKVLTI